MSGNVSHMFEKMGVVHEEMAKINEAIEKFIELRAEKDRAEDRLNAIKADISAHEESLYKLLENANLKSVRHEKYGLISRSSDVKAYCLDNDRNRQIEWLKMTGRGSILKSTVHHSTFSAVIKEIMTENMRQRLPKMNGIPDFVRTTVVERISIRKR